MGICFSRLPKVKPAGDRWRLEQTVVGSMAPMRWTRIPWTRKLLYGVATTVAFFLVAETLLTWVGRATIAERGDPFVGFDSVALFQLDSDSARWRTRPAKLPWFNDQSFTAPKPTDGIRIFCLGGSTTHGRPYDDSLSYCGQLRHLMETAVGERSIEVVNAGGVSYASYRLTKICHEVAMLEPDVIVLYTGHNEFLERRTYAPLEAMPAWQRESASWLGRTQTYSLLSDLLRPTPQPAELQREVTAMLDHAVGPEAYRREDLMRDQVVAHFRWNLRRMADIATDAGALFVLVTPASNVKDMSPFKSEPEVMEWSEAESICADARQALALDNPQAAAQTVKRLLQREPRFAAAWSLAGRAALAMGQPAEAEACFNRAIEEDVCPLRAITPLVEAVRDVAAEKQTPLLDWNRWVEGDCKRRHGHGCPGNDYFVDHVHPTVEMHGRLAMELATLLQPHIEGMPAVDELAASHRLQRWQAAHLTPEKIGASYRNLAKVLNWAGKHEEAGALALRATELIEDAESHVIAAAYLREFQRLTEALDHARRAAKLRPDWPEAQRLTGQLLAERGEWPQAVQRLRRWTELEPENGEAWATLGAALAETDQWQLAVEPLLRAEALDGAMPDQEARTAIVLHRAGRVDEALQRYETLLDREPSRTTIRYNLALLLLELGQRDEARQHLRQAADDGDRQAADLLRTTF